jgi:hypothetical protein
VVHVVCGATDAVLFFLPLPDGIAIGEDPFCLLLLDITLLVLVLLALTLADRDTVDDDDDDDPPGIIESKSFLFVFFLATVTDKLSELQKGQVDCFSFWGLTCK